MSEKLVTAVQPKDEVYIRYVESKDRADWSRLFRKFLGTYENPIVPEGIEDANFDRFLDPEIRMYSGLACVRNKNGTETAIGFTDFYPHYTTWDVKEMMYLNDLYVDPDFRLGGVGRMLIEFVYDESDKMGAPSVYWNTDHFNHRAQLLYTKVGYLSSKRIYKRNGY